MSFWDKLKPAVKVPVAVKADLAQAGRQLVLQWDDGRTDTFTARRLRQECPCAQCVDEWSGQRTLDAASVKPDMAILELSPVGNYALSFVFADKHATGIFNWELLRRLGQQS